MANYSVNQVRQFYVATALNQSSHAPNLTTNGNIGVNSVGEGKDKQVYFLLKNLKTGEVIKSDFINVANIDRVTPIKAADMAYKLKKVEVTLDDDPVVGEDYVLGINFKNFFSSGDDSQYYKNAAVHVTSAIATKSDFYKAVVNALNLAFSREDGATATSNPYLSFSVDNNSTATKIIIEEKEQDWALGTKKQRRIMFDVIPGTIWTGGDDVAWGTVTDVTSSNTNVVGNGKQMANLEWFCMGERGDQYRMMGYPNYIPTEYSIDPSKEYSVIEIHFAFTDTGVSSYRTEKELTIAVPDGASGHVYDVINDIIDEIEYHTGLTIAGLS